MVAWPDKVLRRRCWIVALTGLLLVGTVGCTTTRPLISPCAGSKKWSCFKDRPIIERDWDAWADQSLQSGDIVFGMGDARAFFGLLRFSRVFSRLADTDYSHTGMIIREDDGVYVYDMAPEGARRLKFSDYVIEDKIINLAIKRVREEHRDAIPGAVAYCKHVYATQPEFDRRFDTDDERLYCTELTHRAYQAGGLTLCDSIALEKLPRYAEFPFLMKLVDKLTSIHPKLEIITPGNENHGLWSSPHLELVYEDRHYCNKTRFRIRMRKDEVYLANSVRAQSSQ